MRILGIDPGTATTGFGVIDADKDIIKLVDFGCIKTKPKIGTSERLDQIAGDLKMIIHELAPEILAIEKLFFAKNVKTALAVAEARGVILQNSRHFGLSTFEYSPTEVKTALTGNGQSDKRQVQKMLRLILHLPSDPKPDDAADALAVALCHAQHLKVVLQNPLQMNLGL